MNEDKKFLIDNVFSKYWGRFFVSNETGQNLVLSSSYCLFDLDTGEEYKDMFAPDLFTALPKLHFYKSVFDGEYGKEFSLMPIAVGQYFKDMEDVMEMPYISVRLLDGTFSIISLMDGFPYISTSTKILIEAFDGDNGDFIPISKEEAVRLSLDHYKNEFYGKIYF